ncbi:MAG: ABC transporter substrate-binding protein [Alphaproteobacteria bacterium]|nr:ABC transporter substrate-binding protein [Alphaproteobacteria bacterium]
MSGINRRTMLAGTGAVAATKLYSFTWAGAARAQAEEMLLGIPVETSNSLQFMVASAAGYFKDEGINGRVVTGAAGTNTRQMVAAGQMPYAQGDVIHPLYLTGAGKSAKIMMGLDTRATMTLMVRNELWEKGIRTVEALGNLKKPDGTKPQIAVTRVGAQSWLYGSHMFLKAGLLDNVNFVSTGDGAPMIGAFKSGKVDACMANTLIFFAIADEKLGEAAFNATDDALWNKFFGSAFAGQCLFALEEQIKAKPALTQGIVNAVYRALQLIKNSTPEQLYKTVEGRFMGNFKPEVAMREIAYLKPIYDYNGVITRAQFENGGKVWFSEATKVKTQTYETMVDLSFLDAAKKKFG